MIPCACCKNMQADVQIESHKMNNVQCVKCLKEKRIGSCIWEIELDPASVREEEGYRKYFVASRHIIL